MDDRNKKTPTEPPDRAEQRRPLPLADRRRLVRPAEKSEKNAHTFTDWASI